MDELYELLVSPGELVLVKHLDYATDQERGTGGVILLDVVLIEDEYDALVDLSDEVIFLGSESNGLFAVKQLHKRGIDLIELGTAALGHLL